MEVRAAIDACARENARGTEAVEAAILGALAEREAAMLGAVAEREATMLRAIAECEAMMLRAVHDERTAMLAALAEREATMLCVVQDERVAALHALADRGAETSAGRDVPVTDRAALDSEIGAMEVAAQRQEWRVLLDVGGALFKTSRATLTAVPGSMLEAMFSGRHTIVAGEDGLVFIDRDGEHFGLTLNFL